MPTTPRLWVQIKSGIRPETDAEYLVRLRERAREKASRSAAVDPRRSTAPTVVAFERSPLWHADQSDLS